MNSSLQPNEIIELALPLNGAYVSAARLTVASIANRIGFDVDEIEDLKAAVSEACIYIIKKSPSDFKGTFTIKFLLCDDFLEIHIGASVLIDFNKDDDEEMGLVMIKALMDNLTAQVDGNNSTNIVMVKSHKQSSF